MFTGSLALTALLLAPAPAAAQEGREPLQAAEPPEDRERPEGRKPPEGREPPEAAEAPLRCTPQEPCFEAERQEGLGGGHYRLTGFVDLQFGEARIQADELELRTTDNPDGSQSRRAEARGNVVFLRGEERLAGESLTMDLTTGRGFFLNALGYVQPGVFIEAKKIERVDADTYRIEGGRFTSCSQPTPRWSFSASSATLKVEEQVRARNVVFKVKDVPAFYIPYFVYPIQQDQRSSGLLFPRFGHDSIRGFNVGTGFFWAMGRSFDQTFYADHYSKYGYGLGHELRYALKPPSQGNFRTYGFRRQQGGWEHDFNWNAVHLLPGRVRASVRVQESSTIEFQERFQDSLDLASRRTRFSTASLQRNFGPRSVQLLADSSDTFFGSDQSFSRRRHLPSLLVSQSPQRIGRTGAVFSFEARAENLALGNQERVDGYGRYDLHPRLSRPLSLSFLQLTPEVRLRYTGYGVSDLDPGGGAELGGPPLGRRYVESSLDLRGPTFARVFHTPGNFYADRFKHVIGPEVTWTYRSRVDDFAAIPRFDGHDQIPGTNELHYALVQRFYAKRQGRSGKPEAYEFLNWRLAQTYYVQIAASDFDPNYASAAFGPGGVPDHNSPIQSRLRFRPTPRLSSNFDVEYDVNFKQLRNLSLSATAQYDRARVQASWFRSKRVAGRPENRRIDRDTLRGSARLSLLPGRLVTEASAFYDLLTNELKQISAQARYDVQCCGFIAEVIQSDYNLKQGTEFRFSIELANIGSIGNFMGQDGAKGRGLGNLR